MKRQKDDVAAVLTWHDAVNAGDIGLALAVSTSTIVVGGPKGEASGHAVLAEWIRHAGIRLAPIVVHRAGEHIIVEEDATWPARRETLQDGQPIRVASVFTVMDGLVASVHRFASLDEAKRMLLLSGPRPPA